MSASQAKNWQQDTHTSAPQRKKQVTVQVQKKSWITKGEKILFSIVAFCFIVAGAYIVFYSSSTDSLNRDVQSLQQTVQSQEVKNEELLFQKKELSKPERIKDIAKEHGLKVQGVQMKQAHNLDN